MKLHAELIFIWKVSRLDSFKTEAQENSEMSYWFKMKFKICIPKPRLGGGDLSYSDFITRNGYFWAIPDLEKNVEKHSVKAKELNSIPSSAHSLACFFRSSTEAHVKGRERVFIGGRW